jgi:nucleoside-diphosphate-sugar epimerase
MKRLVITGAEGNIGSRLRAALDAGYELQPLTLSPQPYASFIADIGDLDAILPAFAGADAVVHLAASSQVEAAWSDVLHNNLLGTYNVFEAARRCGVKQIVFASSNHAVGRYEYEASPDLYRTASGVMLDASAPLRPDSLYGVSKAYGEALGRYFSEAFGLSVYCLRIGSIRADDDPRSAHVRADSAAWLPPMNEEQRLRRYAATWMSHADFARLVDACLRAEQIRFGIYYGVSDNPYRFWSLDNARADLGFRPQDAAPPVGPTDAG